MVRIEGGQRDQPPQLLRTFLVSAVKVLGKLGWLVTLGESQYLSQLDWEGRD